MRARSVQAGHNVEAHWRALEIAMNMDADQRYLIEEHGREPWVLPEDALTIAMHSDGQFRLYDTRYFTSNPKKCWDDCFACMLLLRASSGDEEAKNLLSAYLRKMLGDIFEAR